jgi:DNA-binding NarL/FixJ family response regulator
MKKYISILIVDADTEYSATLAKYYRKMPFVKNVATATDYPGLVKEMQHEICDAILVDATVPTTNGLNMCKQIKLIYPEVCIGVLSAKDEPGLLEAAEENGGSAYFLKTVDMDILTRFLLDYKNEKLKGFVAEANT